MVLSYYVLSIPMEFNTEQTKYVELTADRSDVYTAQPTAVTAFVTFYCCMCTLDTSYSDLNARGSEPILFSCVVAVARAFPVGSYARTYHV